MSDPLPILNPTIDPKINPNEEQNEHVSDSVAPILNNQIVLEPYEQPLKRLKGIFRRRKSTGRRKDGQQKKTGSYDFAGVRASHGLHSSARPQEVIHAVMSNQHSRRQDREVRAPLKSEL